MQKEKVLNWWTIWQNVWHLSELPTLISFLRSGRLQMFFKIGVLINFTKFTGKHLCWSLFLSKSPGLEAFNFIKKRLQHRCFPVNFVKFIKTPILKNIYKRSVNLFRVFLYHDFLTLLQFFPFIVSFYSRYSFLFKPLSPG